MKLLEIHTCPIWEEADGTRRVGFNPEDDHPPVVGWCNVGVLNLFGKQVRLVLSRGIYRHRDDLGQP